MIIIWTYNSSKLDKILGIVPVNRFPDKSLLIQKSWIRMKLKKW